MILKQVIRFPETNSVEVTWVDGSGAQVKCHSYADSQMDALTADLGADAPTYADLIATVQANISPPPPPDNAILASKARETRNALLSSALWRIARYWSQSTGGLPTTETAQVYSALLQYAQDLRDVPQQVGFPAVINWPVL